MSKYNEYKKKALSDSEVKREYDELQPEYDIIQAMIDARASQNITQKELSDRTGITQADISRIETVADEMVDQIGESYTQTLYEQMKRNIGQ